MKKGLLHFCKNKKGTILMESVVFIILNLVFLMILILFIYQQGQGVIVYEQAYTKQIALLIDSGKPGMTMILDMENAKKISKKNEISFSEIVRVDNDLNFVEVKLSSESGYKYYFFNDVDVSIYPDNLNKVSEEVQSYVIKINSYDENDN